MPGSGELQVAESQGDPEDAPDGNSNSDSDDTLYNIMNEVMDDFEADDEWHQDPRQLDQDPEFQAIHPIQRELDDIDLEPMLFQNRMRIDLFTRIS